MVQQKRSKNIKPIGRKLASWLLTVTMVVGLMPGMSLTAYAASEKTYTGNVSDYTVEFNFGEKQFVMEGDTTVALCDILDYIGLTGEVSDVKVSDRTLFSASKEGDEWIITAHQAFSMNEWMKVIIDSVVYEIVVTDATYSSGTVDGNNLQVNDIIDAGVTILAAYEGPSHKGVQICLDGVSCVNDNEYFTPADYTTPNKCKVSRIG